MIEGVSACLVTRGNVDMRPIVESLPFDDIIVWDNSKREDFKVYGRYAAIDEAENDIIYVQDDDCIIPVDALLDAWADTDTLLCNMPRDHGTYSDSALVGWGALFHRNLPFKAFKQWGGSKDQFYRDCDVWFTALTPFRRVDLGHENFPYAYGLDRMYNQSYHDSSRTEVLALARAIKKFDNVIEDYLGLEALIG